MQIVLYKVSKRENSTYVPQGIDGEYPVTGDIFEPCSVIRPTITLNLGLSENPSAYNYCYIAVFNRYYWVVDWTYTDGLWQMSAAVDVLASWKQQISASTQYVTRAASQFDGTIIDNLYPCKAATQYTETQCIPDEGHVYYDNYYSGFYVVGVIAPNTQSIGGVAYYVMSGIAFSGFMEVLLSNVDWLDIDAGEISQNIQKMLFNPFDYLISAMWYPLSLGSFLSISGSGAGITTQMPYGWWRLNLPYGIYPLDNSGASFAQHYTVQLPNHPLAGTRGSYLNISPYTRRWLNFPPFGRTALDTTTLIGRSELQIVCRIDTITGKAQLTAGGLENAVCVYENAQLGVPIQISQITTDYISGIQTLGNVAATAGGLIGALGAAGTAGAIVAGTAPSAALAAGFKLSDALGGIGGIGNALQAAFNDVSHSGANGTLVGYGLKPTIGSLFSMPVDDYPDDRGRPLCKAVQLGTLSGYVLCEDSDIKIPATAEETRAIKSFLDAGFYMEG